MFDSQPPDSRSANRFAGRREMPDAAFVGHGRDLRAFDRLIERCNEATIRKNFNL
jgi:hypothetical protein